MSIDIEGFLTAPDDVILHWLVQAVTAQYVIQRLCRCANNLPGPVHCQCCVCHGQNSNTVSYNEVL